MPKCFSCDASRVVYYCEKYEHYFCSKRCYHDFLADNFEQVALDHVKNYLEAIE